MNETPNDAPAPPARIDAAFRNGSLTAIGILLGFSLGFAVTWANDDGPWTIFDLIVAIPLSIGVSIQIKSLAEFLEIDSLEVKVYRRAKGRFLLGLIVTSAGIVSAVIGHVIDAQMALGMK